MLKAVILIGGPQKGTRFRPLSLDIPKPLFPVAGRPIIQFHIEACMQVENLKEILIIGTNAAPQMEAFVKEMQTIYDVSIRYLQEFTALGTAGGMYHFRDQIRAGNPSAFFVLNGDVCADFPLQQLHDFHMSKNKEAEITMMSTEATKLQSIHYGCFVIDADTGAVNHYVEKPSSYVSTFINCGVYITSIEIFFRMAAVFHSRQQNFNNLNGSRYQGHIQWEREIITPMAGTGKLFALPLGPNVAKGAGVTIGKGVRLRESIVLDNAVIEDHSLILHVIVGRKARIGCWSRVEGTPSDPDPNMPFAKMENPPLFDQNGKLNPSITILGQQQIIKLLPNSSGQQLKGISKHATRASDASKVVAQRGMSSASQSSGGRIVSSTPTRTSIKVSSQQMTALKLGNQGQNARIVQIGNDTGSHTNHSKTNLLNNSHGIKKETQSVQSFMRRRRNADRSGKGLRHFSMKVCKKVEEKGTTTYNEVADELVEEEANGQPLDSSNYDQKNIRRRVYDALNVLMAMNIISKDKKEIRWIGLPTNSAQQCSALEAEMEMRRERIESKQQQLRELILQQVSFKSLVTRNKEAEERGLVPSQNSAIQLPFITVNTHKKTQINCSISDDKSEYFFAFDDKFEIHDDIEILKRMGLLLGLDKGECTNDDIQRAKSMVPKSFQRYIELYGKGKDDSNDWDSTFGDMLDSSMDGGIKSEPYDTMYDEDENYSENSNLD